jgi:hypothetical protein
LVGKHKHFGVFTFLVGRDGQGWLKIWGKKTNKAKRGSETRSGPSEE